MDVKYINNNYSFTFRTSAIIYNEDKTKILVFTGNNKNFYLLPGGKVNEKENSIEAIKRELKEELGYTDLKFTLAGISEESIVLNDIYHQQINIIYKTIYKNKINELIFHGLEGNWATYKWIDINELDKIKLYPTNIKKCIETNKVVHFIEDLTK